MKDQFNNYKGDTGKRAQIIAFQQEHPAELLERDRLVSEYDYFSIGLWSLNTLDDRSVKPEYPSKERTTKASKGKDEAAVLLDVASFNLGRHFGSVDAVMDPDTYVQIEKMALRFRLLTDYTCAIVFEELNDKSKQALLVCYPGKVSKDGWETVYSREQRDEAKSKFFAHLVAEGLVTEQQLDSHGITLGTYGQSVNKALKERTAYKPK